MCATPIARQPGTEAQIHVETVAVDARRVGRYGDDVQRARAVRGETSPVLRQVEAADDEQAAAILDQHSDTVASRDKARRGMRAENPARRHEEPEDAVVIRRDDVRTAAEELRSYDAHFRSQ